MLSLLSFVGFVGLVSAQYGVPCSYTGGPNGMYLLNLTSVNGYHLEYKSPDGHHYYHTPCHNGEPCRQGTANFQANTVQYSSGNICNHYLSVDHHEKPTYFFGAAVWAFQYRDGQLCDVTQEPRATNVYYLCDEFTSNTYLYEAYEPERCRYILNVRTPLACVPADKSNANCQWSYTDSSQQTYKLDLSSLNGSIIHDTVNANGYEHYYSPCQNGLHCHQQTGDFQVMSITANRVTHTCEHYLSVWQEGRVQPIFHNNADPNQVHWSFHYYLSEKCSNGNQGEETIRWYCDMSVENYTVINGSYDGNCRWEFNVASAHACPEAPEYTTIFGEKFDFSKM